MPSRRDAYLDAMLKHLGATYYQTLRGEATASEVARAVASVREEADRRPGQFPAPGREERRGYTGRWRVRDVMRTEPVTAGTRTGAREIARLMSEHRVSAVPVVADQGLVVGVVSEADLLRSRADSRAVLARVPGKTGPPDGATAEQLMTAPPIMIHPDAPLAAAARRMDQDHLRMLPVVDAGEHLLGVVSRRNLLSIFLRPDEEIADEVRAVLRNVLLINDGSVTVSARDGAVTLTGHVDREATRRAAVQLAAGVDAVTDVISKLSAPPMAERLAAHP
jgi:CBS domain-containing protein